MARHEHHSLWALAAGELDADASGRVEAHVATCSECAQALEQVRQSRAVLHEGRGALPAPRTDAMSEGLRAEAARRMVRSAPSARWPWAVALAGACAAMLAFWMVRAPRAMDESGAHVARGMHPLLLRRVPPFRRTEMTRFPRCRRVRRPPLTPRPAASRLPPRMQRRSSTPPRRQNGSPSRVPSCARREARSARSSRHAAAFRRGGADARALQCVASAAG
ncbi:zf-HC2 domain-containing protein [Myxococcus sp. MxC21-1]|nr:zf-HC2 domain-containing protein [Myxococcus sp. MxC21-1]